jgi:hypothetical protein
VRNNKGYYRTNQTRYVSVRNIDRYESPRYVAVRRQRPVYVDSGVRYVAVRRAEPRVRYVPIQEFEDDGYDDEIRYVKTRRNYDSGTRYVAVRGGNAYYEAPRTRYVAVRSNINTGCARPVALRSCLDDVETTSVRRVVVRNDGYANRTNYVAVRDEFDYRDHEDFDESDGDSDVTVSGEIDDDAEYFVQPTQRASRVKYVDNSYADDFDSDNVVYVASNRMGNNCMRQVAVRSCSEAYSTRTISYAPVSYYDDDLDDQAFLDGGGATYVAAGDIGDACLSTVAVRRSPAMVSTRTISYVPVDDVDDYAFHSGSGSTYIETERPHSEIAYLAADEDEEYIDADAAHVVSNDMGTVSYVPAAEVEEMEAENVSNVPMDDVEDVDTEVISYVPADRMNVRTVSNVPIDSAYDVDATYTAADDCPELVSSVEAEPVYVVDASTVIVEAGDAELVAGLHGTQRIAGSYGFRDGFEDGQEAALERDEYHPENSGDFQKATEGYEDEYGDKGVYKDVYRNTYLQGYREGFESTAGLT